MEATQEKKTEKVDLKIEGLTDATDQLRSIYDLLFSRLEQGMEVISKLPSGKAREKAETRYKALSDARQRIALVLDVLEERAEVEERGSARGGCYLVILPKVESP